MVEPFSFFFVNIGLKIAKLLFDYITSTNKADLAKFLSTCKLIIENLKQLSDDLKHQQPSHIIELGSQLVTYCNYLPPSFDKFLSKHKMQPLHTAIDSVESYLTSNQSKGWSKQSRNEARTAIDQAAGALKALVAILELELRPDNNFIFEKSTIGKLSLEASGIIGATTAAAAATSNATSTSNKVATAAQSVGTSVHANSALEAFASIKSTIYELAQTVSGLVSHAGDAAASVPKGVSEEFISIITKAEKSIESTIEASGATTDGILLKAGDNLVPLAEHIQTILKAWLELV